MSCNFDAVWHFSQIAKANMHMFFFSSPGNASQGGSTYVHCKAGRGRSTTIVLCYLIKYRNMTPEAALDHARSVRPRVLLAPSQWQACNPLNLLCFRVLVE